MQCCAQHAVLCTTCITVCDMQYCVRNAVLCTKCSTVYEMQYGVQYAVLCATCSTVCDTQYRVRHSVPCATCSTVYEMQYGVQYAVLCATCGTVCDMPYCVRHAVRCATFSTVCDMQNCNHHALGSPSLVYVHCCFASKFRAYNEILALLPKNKGLPAIDIRRAMQFPYPTRDMQCKWNKSNILAPLGHPIITQTACAKVTSSLTCVHISFPATQL